MERDGADIALNAATDEESTIGAQDKLADMGSAVREKASSAKESLANVLTSGADRLRQRTAGNQTIAAADGSAGGAGVAAHDGRVAQISDKVANGMDATADWIRQADMDSARLAVERQVREHPGRTLLIAAGVGYLIGKAIRSRR